MARAPKIYLDACALNRPFDDRSIARNRIEAEAVIALLAEIEARRALLVGSEVLDLENERNPFSPRRERIASFLAVAEVVVRVDTRLRRRAKEIEAQGLDSVDALHIAAAERGRAKWFVTCDDGILKRALRGNLEVRVSVTSPTRFFEEGALE